MDTERFVAEVRSRFPGGDLLAEPFDGRFARLVDQVEGMASPNKLAILNAAGAVLPLGEAYLEVGAYKGLSIIGAALGNEGKRFVTIDSFSGFGMWKRRNREALQSNLDRWGRGVEVIDG